MNSVVFCLARLVRRRRLQRLTADVAAYEQELVGRKQKDCGFTGDLSAIDATLKRAHQCIAETDVDGGWKCLQTAQRLEYFVGSPEHLKAAAVVLRNEADKLRGWRKDSMVKLLTAEQGAVPHAQNMFQAALLRDGFYNNEAYKDGLRRSSALILATVLFAGLVALFYLARNEFLAVAIEQTPADEDLWQALLCVAVIGLLGATVSAMTDMPTATGSTRIPETALSFRAILLRLMIGPASAIIVYLALQSSLAGKIFTADALSGYVILIYAFAAGFTERLVLRVIESVAGKKEAGGTA